MAGLTRDVVTRYLADTKQHDQATKNLAGSNDKVGKSFSNMAGFAKAGIAAVAGSQVLSAIGSTIGAATNLGESVNAVNVTFGKSADQIHDWAEDAAQSAGLAHSAANNLIVPIGAALQNVGLSADEAGEKSIELAQRAADMASVFNVDVSEALGAIQAGLRGEADPLERFGVGLSAAKVEAFLLAKGMVKSKGAITDADKVMGRYMLLMQESEKVAGDFRNTSDSLANQQRVLAADLENTKAKLGELLVPMASAATGEANILMGVLDLLMEKLEGVEGAAGEASKSFADKDGGVIGAFINVREAAFDWFEALLAVEEAQKNHLEMTQFMADAKKDDLLPAIEDVTAAIYDEIDAHLASANPTFAAFKAMENLTAAGEAYTRALSEHGPKSDEARDAGIDLAEAYARVEETSDKFAEEGGQAAIDALILMLQNAGVAADSIDSIVASILTLNKTPIKKFPGSGGGGSSNPFIAHDGGVVPGPRGQEQWALVKGGETILPTHKGPVGLSGSGGGGTVNNYITVHALDPQAAGRAVVEVLQSWQRANGALPITVRG